MNILKVNKDTHTISNLISDALVLYGEISPPNLGRAKVARGERSQEAIRMLEYMKKALRIDVTPNHFAGAIRATAVEENWKDASGLFLSQLDDFAGLVPMNVKSEALELGLYAVARAKKEDTSISDVELGEDMFQIASSLAIISPLDIDECKSLESIYELRLFMCYITSSVLN